MHPKSTPSRQQFVALCACGCGQPTLIAQVTRTGQGITKGQPNYVLKGHSNPVAWRRVEQGYIFLYVPDHRYAIDGYVQEHRLVMELVLDRYLTPDEVVHHKNGQKQDNRPENLQVMTQAEHMRLHLSLDRWSRDYAACIECGKTDSRYGANGRCHRCYERQRYNAA